jgi:hypothetical protein
MRRLFMADDDNIKQIPISAVRNEEDAPELPALPEMEPYIRFAKAVMQNADQTELEAIRQLPLERRYVWRVASALQWALADCDDLSVQADKETLMPEDFAKVMDLLKLRPMQLGMFLKSLVGVEEMERLMVQAIEVARTYR